ncbi:MAG: rhodanese-like domain-containing protein [Thiotrichaceae bacterium]|nr:rhodanese-like domain-containing protein [Thiotrichaceae bacterium]
MSHLIELTAKQAFTFLTENPDARLVDIRSSMEFLFIGHPTTAIHLAWMDDPDWDINPNFVKEVSQQQVKNSPIVLICRSGNRSEKAGKQLIEAGLSHIYHINDGFEGDRDDENHRGDINGWRWAGLPWEQC